MGIDMSLCPEEKPVRVYNPDGSLLLETTHIYKYNWVRWQIAENRLEGYVAEWNGKKYPLNKYGNSVNNDGGEILPLDTDFAINTLKASVRTKKEEGMVFLNDIEKANF